jgi:hypothetical protein
MKRGSTKLFICNETGTAIPYDELAARKLKVKAIKSSRNSLGSDPRTKQRQRRSYCGA